MQTFRLSNVDCAECARSIEDAARKTTGVRHCSVDFGTLSMRIDAHDIDPVLAAIRRVEPGVSVERLDRMRRRPVPDSFDLARELILLAAGLILLVAGLLLGRAIDAGDTLWLEYLVFGAAYLLAGAKVLVSAARNVIRGAVFDETFLMSIATAGAFAIRQPAEAVAVMLLYKAGEILQALSVARSRRSIQSLLDMRPDSARVMRDGGSVLVVPEEVKVGELVQVRAGERIPLDGLVEEGSGFLDVSALTGEPVPRRIERGDEALAGSLIMDAALIIRVSRVAGESGAARIIELVENATHAKARPERLITRFARVYTPVVVAVAAAIAVVPPLVAPGASFADWLYRALTILVISCPCALVISIPLGYFAGVGGASRRGILVKGATYLDVLADIRTVVFDKTGTLTEGVFEVTRVEAQPDVDPNELLQIAALAEAHSNHPIAASIARAYSASLDASRVTGYVEVRGQGVRANIDGRPVLAGNDRLLHSEGIAHSDSECEASETVVHVAVDGVYQGQLLISDRIKDGAGQAIEDLGTLGVDRIVLLTGDSNDVAARTAKTLAIPEAYGELLPEDKLEHLESLVAGRDGRGTTAFVGDGINDAPVLARADAGIAMGQYGSDSAVEVADVVFMSDDPRKLPEAIQRGRKTRTIIVQNIVFALVVKLALVALGGIGLATMWEAVIGDMGVALLAVLNSTRAIR